MVAAIRYGVSQFFGVVHALADAPVPFLNLIVKASKAFPEYVGNNLGRVLSALRMPGLDRAEHVLNGMRFFYSVSESTRPLSNWVHVGAGNGGAPVVGETMRAIKSAVAMINLGAGFIGGRGALLCASGAKAGLHAYEWWNLNPETEPSFLKKLKIRSNFVTEVASFSCKLIGESVPPGVVKAVKVLEAFNAAIGLLYAIKNPLAAA